MNQAGDSGFKVWRARLADRHALWRVRRAPPASGFTHPPEPALPGFFALGRQLAAGNFALAGHRIEAPNPWLVESPSTGFLDALHGFGWLDHLGAVGDRAAREAAQSLVDQWIGRHGKGQNGGLAWQADLCGRRAMRWIDQGLMLTAGRDSNANAGYFAVLGRHMAFLARRWQSAPPGLGRLEAVSGWLMGALSLQGMADHVDPASRALADTCTREIDAQGAIASRNPEELAEILMLLVRLRTAFSAQERRGPPVLTETAARVAVVLRKLRHVDGGLARFHGGGRGAEGRLEKALDGAGNVAPRKRARHRLARAWHAGLFMGYARLEAGRVSVIVDAAAPPSGPAARRAHASTLAFELTSNRRPVVVSCGPGGSFGAEWERAGRATLSHSTLSVDGWSSARFARAARATGDALTDGPTSVELHRTDERHASALLLSHDGYVATHGLTHVRNLDLSADGRALLGEDRLVVLDPAHRDQFWRVQAEQANAGIRYALRFHLHPEADASLDMNGAAVSIALPSGEIWVLRFDGPGSLSLEPSVYLEPGRSAPRASRQIVIRAAITQESAQINWTLAKAQDTPLAIRDIGRDDPLYLPEPLVSDD
ncbi:MAG: heparinase II/III family protein [Pararhodobacter sp.]